MQEADLSELTTRLKSFFEAAPRASKRCAAWAVEHFRQARWNLLRDTPGADSIGAVEVASCAVLRRQHGQQHMGPPLSLPLSTSVSQPVPPHFPWGVSRQAWRRHVANILVFRALLRGLHSSLVLFGQRMVAHFKSQMLQRRMLPLASVSWSGPPPRHVECPDPQSTPRDNTEGTFSGSESESTQRSLSDSKSSERSSSHNNSKKMKSMIAPNSSGTGEHVVEEGEHTAQMASGKARIMALYVSSSRHYCPDIFTSGFSFKPWTEYWALLSTGEVYLGLPHGDPRAFDFEEERRDNPHRFLALEPLPGSPQRGLPYQGHLVHFDPAKPSIRVCEGVVFTRVPSHATGWKLRGTYLHDAPRDIVESSESFGLHGATAISFSTDGTFSIRGCARACFGAKASPGRPGGRGGEESSRGLYQIDGNVIEFRYDGGGVEDAFFFEFPDLSGKIVSINGVSYKRTD